MGGTIGYLRVSTADQDLEKNKADILQLANDKKLGHVEWIEEKVSGIKDWKKRALGTTFGELQAGDTVIVSELSRLGRSTLQILEIMKMAKENDIVVHAVKGNWSLNGSMESKIVLTMFAMIAEIERDLISERTKEGLRARKAAGVKLGRPKGPGKSKLDQHREEIWFCRKLDSAIGSLASFCYDILIFVEVTQWQARKGFTVGIFRSASFFKQFSGTCGTA